MNRVAIILAALFALVATPAMATDSIVGRWITPEKDAVITISKCGSSYCGRLSKYLVKPEGGVNQKDVNNPNKRLRSRKLLGVALLSGLKKDGKEYKGTIYDPRNGKSYRSVVRRKSASVLVVKGCLGPFCQSQNWTRAR